MCVCVCVCADDRSPTSTVDIEFCPLWRSSLQLAVHEGFDNAMRGVAYHTVQVFRADNNTACSLRQRRTPKPSLACYIS